MLYRYAALFGLVCGGASAQMEGDSLQAALCEPRAAAQESGCLDRQPTLAQLAPTGRRSVPLQAAQIRSGGRRVVQARGYCDQANIRCAHLFPGADAGQRIANAIDDIKTANSRGGTVDARGVTDANMSGFTVRRGVTVLLPAREFILTGTIKVEGNAGLFGSVGSNAKDFGTLLAPTSAVAERAVWAAPIEVVPERWWVGGEIAHLRIQADDMPPGSNCVDVHQMGENSSIHHMHLQSCKNDGIYVGSEPNRAPANQAGANFLGTIAVFNVPGCALTLQNIASEFFVDGFSGDSNQSMLCVTDTRFNGASIIVNNFKSETFVDGRQDPVVRISNTDALVNIFIVGGKHSCGSNGGCSDFIRIENTTPGEAPFITVMGKYVAGYENFINDVSNNLTVPSSERIGKLNLFTYSGEDRPDVRVWHARSAVRFSNLSQPPSECSPDVYGSQYFSTPDQRMCVCGNDGVDDAWLKTDNYSHSSGHCSQ